MNGLSQAERGQIPRMPAFSPRREDGPQTSPSLADESLPVARDLSSALQDSLFSKLVEGK